ncbi:hypothetical protein Taro_038386 [Colocasia esculenta]|uniref:Uncharacterized protein n=1 Tax=Colocasia esculenta TaxID=4460 RepID=A0A843WNK1_COLES|nr:hypothetical protein [Colocasia esculenta]
MASLAIFCVWEAMENCGRRSTQAREDEQRREERVQAMQTQAQTQTALQAQLLKLQLQFPRSMAMVVRPSWRGETGVSVLEEDIVRSDSKREE